VLKDAHILQIDPYIISIYIDHILAYRVEPHFYNVEVFNLFRINKPKQDIYFISHHCTQYGYETKYEQNNKTEFN